MHRRILLGTLLSLATVRPVRAQPSPGTPEAQVRALVAAHAPFILDVGPGVFDSEEHIRRFFTPQLAEAILRSQALARANPGEVVEGTLDFDPITGANAPEMRDLLIEPATVNGGEAEVVTTFRRGAETIVRIRYLLIAREEAWLIDDIVGDAVEGDDGWSVRRILRLRS